MFFCCNKLIHLQIDLSFVTDSGLQVYKTNNKQTGHLSGLSLGRLVSNLKSVALTVFELLAFNSQDRPLRTHTDRHTETHTSNERIISAIHFVHLAEIKNIIKCGKNKNCNKLWCAAQQTLPPSIARFTGIDPKCNQVFIRIRQKHRNTC